MIFNEELEEVLSNHMYNILNDFVNVYLNIKINSDNPEQLREYLLYVVNKNINDYMDKYEDHLEGIAFSCKENNE